MHLTLLVPELIWPEPADQFTLGHLTAPGLQWLLARAKMAAQPRRPQESVLASLFGWHDTASGQSAAASAPLAALRLLGDGDERARSGHWLCADPVHLRFHQERIVLADASAFDLERAEAEALVASLNQAFADIGEFHLTNARRWYLRLNVASQGHFLRGAVDHPAEPLSAVAGRLVNSDLQGDAQPLKRWLNEVQMFLHGHPVNEQRQAEGKPAINSLWLWGGGEWPIPAENCTENRGQTPIFSTVPVFSSIFADDQLAAGLAHAAGIPLHAAPATLATALPQAGEQPLIVLDQLLPYVLHEDGDSWRNAFAQLETDWFAPLQKALGKQVDRISLIAPTIYGQLHYTVDAVERWKFWKSAPPIQAIATALANTPANIPANLQTNARH